MLLAPGVVPDASAQAPATASVLSPAAAREQAERLRRDGRLPEALAGYRTLVELDPKSFEDRFWVARLESWTGRLESAESAFVSLLGERPDDYDSRIALADVRMWRGDRAGARIVLEDLGRTHPEDAEVVRRLEAIRRPAFGTRWEAELEYFGERLARQPATNGATLSLGLRSTDRLRWRTAATVQEKFDRTESRFGAAVAYRATARTEIEGSAFVAPGAEVLPRQTYGMRLGRRVGRHLVLDAEYTFLDFHDADVHQAGPGLELYAGQHWLVAARYRWSGTRFGGVEGSVGHHAGSLALGYLYGPANLVRIFAATGAESFAQPSRDRIGEFNAHTIGVAWRHFASPRLGLELLYAHQDRSDGADQDSYGVRLVQRW